MTENVSQAIAKRDTGPGALVAQYAPDFTTVLPSHVKPETWVRLAQGLLRRDKNLARIATANPGSLMQALMECARLGHEPGTEAFYLVPMGNEIEGWEGYRGVVERMYRAGAVVSVKAELVRENDVFEYDPAEMPRPHHKVDWFGDRGEIIGAYSYAEMAGGGTSRVVIIDKTYIAKVRAQSKGSNSSSSPWVKWEESMVLKTVIHRLEPFVPTSSEYLRDRLRAVRDVSAEPAPVGQAIAPLPAPMTVPDLPADDDAVVDAEILDDEFPNA